MSTRRLVVIVVVLLLGVAPAAAQTVDVDARLLFRIDDDRVTESSGLVVSRTREGLAYTVNDSGDDARVLVISMADGDVVGETRLAGVEAVDVEALASAPGGRLVVADIGDNGADRESVGLYVIDEPRRGAATVVPRRVSLTYPGGPRDAEAAVVVGRRLFVVTKEILGGTVFAAPVFGHSHNRYVLRRVASAPRLVTDATRLADGRVVLRDYGQAHVVRLPRWRVAASYPLPRVEQGETVAAAPQRRLIYVGSEGANSPVFVLPVPAVGDNATAERATAERATASRAADPDEGDRPRARPPAYVVAAVAAIVVAFLVRRYRRRN